MTTPPTNDGRGGGILVKREFGYASLKFIKLYPNKRNEIDEMAYERIINAYEK